MSLSFFASNPLEVAHVGSVDGDAYQAQVVDLGHFFTSLVVLEEQLDVLDVLKLDKLQIDWISIQLVRA